MDELTRERFPHAVPWRERYARPNPRPRGGNPVETAVVNRRRVILAGTHDLTVQSQGGNVADLARVGERRLIRAIRTMA